MALIKGGLISEASGKLGGIVFAHNSGGQYVRQFRVPTNPNTAAQQRARQDFGQASIRWRDTLTAAQRAAWNAIAPTITAKNALGDTIQLNGQQAYVRASTIAALLNLPDPAAAPAETGETPLGAITIADFENGLVTLDIDGTPPWAADANGRFLFFLGQQRSVATNFYKGPFRYAAAQAGNSTPVDQAQFMPLMTVGGKYFIRCFAYLGGRLSQAEIISGVAS